MMATAALVGLYFRWFRTQHDLSLSALQDWGHAYAVPVISAYLVWKAQKQIVRTPVEPFWPGLAPMLLGIMTYFFAVVGIKNHMIQGLALVLTIFGVALLLCGPRMMRHLFLPISFLVFGITVSQAIMNQITFPLQLLASQGGYVLLSLAGFVGGFTVDVANNVLNVTTATGESHPLNVAEACSGMRMVVAFLALGGATCLLACRFWWQRILLLLLAAPVAILINAVRVAVLGVLTLYDANLATGEAHVLVGTILLIPGLGLFLLVVKALNLIVPVDGTDPKKGASA